MKRLFILVILLIFSTLSFAQQSGTIKITGRIPSADDTRLYQIQVGAFKVTANAQRAFENLRNASLNPVYEQHLDLTRVMIAGIRAGDISFYIEKIKNAGFPEVYIKIDTRENNTVNLPVSTAALPSTALTEIAYRTIKTGETRSLADITRNRNVVSWTSSTPSIVSVDSNGTIRGMNIGNAYIRINANEYISIIVVPQETFYVVPESQAALLPANSRAGEASTGNLIEYRTEPTFRLAYRFNNKGEGRGASGTNGGIDILGRGANYEWLWTTYEQGGWFYDLNGIKREMINGYQKDANNGVELTVKPEFVYDNGVPFLQLKHILHNPNNFAVTEQRFGASADVMIHQNDFAPLVHTPYGTYMTDSETNPSLELMFICESGNGINPVDSLWLGTWNYGYHLNYIYTDDRSDVYNDDSAIGFSYKNITLAPGETKEMIVRFTLARRED
jgi:hypothetical protein